MVVKGFLDHAAPWAQCALSLFLRWVAAEPLARPQSPRGAVRTFFQVARSGASGQTTQPQGRSAHSLAFSRWLAAEPLVL